MTSGPSSSAANNEHNNVVQPPVSRHGSTVLLLGIVVLFVAARMWRLAASCLWFDEIFSVHAARHAWTDLLRFVAADIIHPPLFYLLLKLWIGIGGESLLWLRLLPALLSIAAIVPFFLLCRELELSRHERNLALLLLTVNGYLIKYAQEVRMYSLLMFLSVCSLWLFTKLFRGEQNSRKQFVWLLSINLLLVYTHYAGWLVVLVEACALLIWQRPKVKQFLLTVAITILAYAPWLCLIYRNPEAGKGLAQNIGWVMRPTLWDVVQFYALLNKPFWFVQSNASRPFDLLTAGFAFLLLGFPLLLLSIQVWRQRHGLNETQFRALRALGLFLAAPVIIVFALSWFLPHSIWGTRHFIIVAAPYSILVAIAIIRLTHAWARITVAVILGSWLLLAGCAWALADPSEYIWCTWEPLARQVVASEPQATAEVRVYAFEDLVAYHLWFAGDSTYRDRYRVFVIKNLEGIQEDTAYFLPRQFNEIAVQNISQVSGNEIWIAFRTVCWDDTQPPLSNLKTMGYVVQNIYSRPAQGQQAFMVRMTRESK